MPTILGAVALIVANPHDISVSQLATIFTTVLDQFNTHGRQLAAEISKQIAEDRDSYAEGLAWLEDIANGTEFD